MLTRNIWRDTYKDGKVKKKTNATRTVRQPSRMKIQRQPWNPRRPSTKQTNVSFVAGDTGLRPRKMSRRLTLSNGRGQQSSKGAGQTCG